MSEIIRIASEKYVDNAINDLQTNLETNYYTKADVDDMEFITIEEIDEICGRTI